MRNLQRSHPSTPAVSCAVEVDQQEALLRALRITPADLQANRLGRLGTTQRRRTLGVLALSVVIGLGLSAWVLIPTFNQARTPGVEAQNWIIPGVAGLAVAVLTVVGAWTTLRRMQRHVECVTGPVTLHVGRTGRGGTADRLEVAGRAFPLPRSALAASGAIPAYRAILTDRAYHVYVQGLRLLAIEPVPVSVLDLAAAGDQGSVAVVGTARPRQVRRTWFLKACFVFVLLGTIGIGAGGVYLTVIQFTGVAAKATVTECVQDTDSRYPGVTYDCTGTWVSGGDLVGGNGHVIVGTVEGADITDVGKAVDVRLAGGEAYVQSLLLPLLLMGLGFPSAALIGYVMVRSRQRPEPSTGPGL
jgi:hypothetical protein